MKGDGAPPPIDLRSDTVTRPAPEMRAAMACAEVGDDVLGDDPTVDLLEQRIAALLGQEAAVFVPSGSMANQIALLLHCRPGDEVIVGEGAHMAFHEAGAATAIAGVQLVAVGTGRGGVFSGADVAATARPDSRFAPPTRLVCVENTHNRGGGTVWPREDLDSVVTAAHDHGLALHLDGARLLNAAVVSKATLAELATPFDTVSFAFSKALGAPVGSVIAGKWPQMERAARLRKMLGGGMRQSGILAAAALWALDNHMDKIADDHLNARWLAERLAALPGVRIDLEGVQSNIVMADLSPPLPLATEMVTLLDAQGVRTLAFGPRRLRLVTHLDVDRAACERAADKIADVVNQLAAAAAAGRP